MVMLVGCFLFLDWNFGNQRIGGKQQGRHAGRVLQCRADHFNRVDNTSLEQVAVLVLICVVAFILSFFTANPIHHHGAVDAGIIGDRSEWNFERGLNNLRA